MGHGSDSPQGNVDGTDSKDTTPKSTLSRPSSRRTLRSFPSSDGSTSHPLFAGPASSSPTEPAGGYAVYNPGKKRASLAGSGLLSPNSASSPTASPLSPSDQPLSPLHSSSSTPPFTPATSTPTLPPLVSRPSNSTLPTTSGRPYARSVSEAQETLKKQALKAELQGLGLAPESIGAALVARLGAAGGEAELKGVQAAIGSGKVALLLPAEKADPSSPISASFLLDHLILLDRERSSRNGSPGPQGFATLTGLRGYMSTDELVFTSCGTALIESEGAPAAGSVDYADESVQRSLRGSAAPPPPPQSPHYPSTMLISSLSALSIPSSTAASSSAASSSSARSTATSRLAALFAKPTPAAASENTADLPPVVPAPAGLFGSDTSSSEGSSGRRGSTATLDAPVLAVGKAVRHAEVVAAIGAGVEGQLREASKTVPGTDGDAAPVDHLVAFAARFQPPSSSSSSSSTPTEPTSPSSSLYSASVDTASDAFQDTLHSVRLDLTRNLGSAPPAPSASSSSPSGVAPAPTPTLEDFAALEDRVDASLEELEFALTSTLYDRLYAPPTARDLSDDEQLCSRVAALNVLELDLDHLGLELGDEEWLEGWEGERRSAREALEELADRAGKELNRLEDADQRTPSAKLAILVECHTLLVDGLSKLPPVPLKKELGDGLGGSPSTSSSAPHEVEMDDASSRASSAPPSRPLSPPAPAMVEEDLQRTPKPHQAMLEQDVPEIRLPGSSAPSIDGELSSSMLEAASSSLYDPASTASPPVSVFESSRPASSKSNTSSADLILPLLIFSVVRANPPHLISHLSFIQRFRSDSLLRGQSSYCLTNFSAVVEFLTHLDVSALGITSQRLLGLSSPAASPALSTASSSSSSSLFPSAFGGVGRPRAHTTGRLRDRLPQDAAALVGAAGTNLFGVVDSSYRLIFSGARGAARGAAGVVGGAAPRSLEEVKSVLEGARGRARDSLPFRRAGPSRTFGSAATSGEDAGAEVPAGAGAGTGQREMVDITPSTPDGTPDTAPADAYAALPSSTTAPPPPPPRHPDTVSLSSSPTKPSLPKRDDSDARSIRSISSLIKESTLGRALGEVRDGVVAGATSPGVVTSGGGGAGEDRPQSLGERLAGLPLAGLARLGGGVAATSSSPAGSRRSTILNPVIETSELASEEQRRRFMEVGSAAELKLGEVQVLLEEWRRAVRRVEELEAVAKAKEGGLERENDTVSGRSG